MRIKQMTSFRFTGTTLYQLENLSITYQVSKTKIIEDLINIIYNDEQGICKELWGNTVGKGLNNEHK